MLPLAVPVAVLAGLGVLAYVVTHKKTDPNAQPVPGGGPVGPQGATPVMSAQMRSAFDALMAGSDPDAMDACASALEPFGFLTEAAQLRAQAGALRKARTAGVQAPPPPAPKLPQPALPRTGLTGGPATPQPAPSNLGDVDAPGFLKGATDAGAAVANQILTQAPAAPPAALPSFAVVTTSDPAPSGDLMIRPAPNAAGTPGVGAEKNGIVTVIKKDVLGDGVWSQVVWGGGSRLPPASGFVKSAFLRASAVGPLGTAIAGLDQPQVRVMAPSGARLRRSPSAVADFRAIVGNGEAVTVRRTIPGKKLESFSPGKGGWALVKYKNLEGWLPLEWLVKA